jgi:predicted CoA-binding protein
MNDIAHILSTCRRIAVVGISSKPDRASNGVSRYMLRSGYEIIPVNPMETEVLGLTCYPDLASVPGEIDMVNIFRKSEDVPPVVEEAIARGAKAIWMQLGVVNESAAERARAAGLAVVMDRCLMVEHMNQG